MARLKRTSNVLEVARQRLAGLKAINPAPNLGPNLTATIYEATIDSVDTRLNSYNQKLADIDQDQNDLQAAEAELNELNRRILSGGEAQYGPDSSEYEMLGGTRTSDHQTPTRKSLKGTPTT
jgi:hypothetical protein